MVLRRADRAARPPTTAWSSRPCRSTRRAASCTSAMRTTLACWRAWRCRPTRHRRARQVRFSVTGHDAEGRPQYKARRAGSLERNVMRYYLRCRRIAASALARPRSASRPGLRTWSALTERHAAQLHEYRSRSIWSEKRRDLARMAAQNEPFARVIFASSLGTVFEWYDFTCTARSPRSSPSSSSAPDPTPARRFIFRAARLSPPVSSCVRSARWCSAAWAT